MPRMVSPAAAGSTSLTPTSGFYEQVLKTTIGGFLSPELHSHDICMCVQEANDLLVSRAELGYLYEDGNKSDKYWREDEASQDLQEALKTVEEETKSNSMLEQNFTVSYGGKWDIVQAIRSISRKAKAEEIGLQDVDEAWMNQQLSTNGLQVPNPDLMIRTGHDQKVNNFLMWQISHTEFYFTDVYGPDCGEPHFIDTLRWFQQCDRRFGK
ncbi:hypothetical protein Cgig2_024022 [Carnegiea gigantea]|uniref:Alkyl transferase n=1 Tax=Carnegiea gigantea TaxID=171969 RepID=A0A9Q1KJE9_9CARY|nr:hypothetical protein Cgig2_024022 [Carnegiea gigantea]